MKTMLINILIVMTLLLGAGVMSTPSDMTMRDDLIAEVEPIIDGALEELRADAKKGNLMAEAYLMIAERAIKPLVRSAVKTLTINDYHVFKTIINDSNELVGVGMYGHTFFGNLEDRVIK